MPISGWYKTYGERVFILSFYTVQPSSRMQEDKIFQYPLAACERQDLNGGKGVVER